MANNDPRKASWKSPGGTGGGKMPAASHKRDWHPTAPTVKAAGPRRRPVLLVALAGAVLLGLIVAVILLVWPPKMPRLIVVGPAQAGNLVVPPNVAGAGGARSLVKWAKEGSDRPRPAGDVAESVVGDAWARGLEDVREDAVIVYLGLNGGADAAGPFLWLTPPNATSPSDKDKLRITDVLNRLAQLPEKKHKLLILDAAQVPVSYVHGQLHNDFARALRKLEAEIVAVPRLVVLCSADEDQRSWVSEEWQQPIFTHLFIEGVKGAAPVDRVTADELVKYLQSEVPAWTRANRGEEQIPFLLPTKGGMDFAKKITLASVSHAKYIAPDPHQAPGANFEPLKSLDDAWERREAFSKQRLLPPEAIAPLQWRTYLDTLLRIETMLRAGAPRAEIEAGLDRLPKNGDGFSRQWPDLSSLGNALPMPAALGSPAARTPLDAARFQALWADPANDWPNLRQSVESQGDVAITRLRLDVCAQLLEYLVHEDKPENLGKAAQLLQIVFGPSAAPVEAHLIRILARDLDTGKRPDWKLIQQALQVHRLAEEAAIIGGAAAGEFPASEQVYPWVKDAIAKADVERLRGTDLLISSEPGDWAKGGKRLETAGGMYRDILKKAKQVREALAARNTALAELPYYGRWVAGLRDEFDDADERRRLLERVERIAENTHSLSSMLEEANPTRLGEMSVATAAVNDDVKKLTDQFFASIGQLNGEVLISRWHRIDNALQVPFIPAKRRAELLANLRLISQSLNNRGQDVGGSAASKSELSPLEAAQRQGRVALALLGSAWVNNREMRDESRGAAKFNYDDLKQRIASPRPDWWLSINEAGEQIGWHWRALASKADALTEKAARDPLDAALAGLARADTLARSADSATALDKDHDPVGDYRRHRLHDFLLAQAKRTIEANWAAADVAAPHSFAEVTAEKFVNDAERLIMMGADKNPSPEEQSRLRAAVKPAREALAIPQYDLSPDQRSVDLIDQQKEFRLKFTIRRPTAGPPGYPVMHYESGGAARMRSDVAAGRLPVIDFADGPQAPTTTVQEFVVGVEPGAVAMGPSFVTAKLWHRGHRTEKTIPVALDREPSGVLALQPAEGGGTFAVRAGPDLRAGAVAILLDWSKSMNTNPNNAGSRYDQALGALKRVLAELPPNTYISLMAFGEPREGVARPPFHAPIQPNYQANPHALDELIKDLGDRQPRGDSSPIARSIAHMATAGLPRDFTGFKTILVLTDGDDNVDEGGAGHIVVNAIQGKGIDLKMIFFLADKVEEANARKQFQPVLDMDPPGEFYTAKNQNELIRRINDAMRPRVMVNYTGGEALTRVAPQGLPVAMTGSNLVDWWRPFLPPGTYQLRTLNANANMLLSRGDRLLLELVRNRTQVEFRPHLYIPDVIPKNSRGLTGISADGQNVHAGLANCKLTHNATTGRDDLDLELLLERDRLPAEMQVTRPKFVWVEVRTQDGGQNASALRARVDNKLYLPSPAYRVRVWDWPALHPGENVRQFPARPAINVWWRESLPVEHVPISRDSRKSDDENFAGKTFTRDGKLVTIESVVIEGQDLVVRVSYPPGAPVVFVQPERLKVSPGQLAEEHRFYEKSGKYTARFGPLSEDDRKQAFTLAFYSMAAMKGSGASTVELRPDIQLGTNDLLGQDILRPID